MEIYITENLADGGFENKYPEGKICPIESRKCLDYLKFQQDSIYIYFANCEGTKVRFGIVYILSGRGNSNRSAIIEYDICEQSFKGDDLYDIVEQLKKALEKGDYSLCDYLKVPKGKSNGNAPIIPNYFPKEYAYREYTGENGLKELISLIDQDEYRKYKAVIFIEKNGNVTPWDSVIKIDKPLETYCTLTPAEQTKGVKVKIRIGAEENDFDAPIRVKKDDDVTLKFSREGFDTAHPEPTVTFKVTEDRKYTMPNIIWSRYIGKNNILVSADGKTIAQSEYSLRVNDSVVKSNNNGVEVPEDKLGNVKIKIEKEGFDNCEKTVDFRGNSVEKINLMKKSKTINLKYNDVYFVGQTNKNLIFPKNIKEISSGSTYEITEIESPRTAFFIIGLICFIAGIALGWFVIANIFKETPPEQAESEVNTEAVASPAPETQETKEFACLKEDIWKKSEMEKVSELQGLYDAISETNRDKIYKYKSIIEKYENGKKLIKALEETDTTTITWGKNPDDNKNGEITITIEDYISRLRGKYKSQQASAKQSQAPSSANNSTTNSSKSSEGSSKSNGMTEEE